MGKLSLPSNPTAKSPIPKIRATELLVTVGITTNSLLRFQRCHQSDADRLKIPITLNPIEFDSRLGQTLICSDLSKKPEISFNYNARNDFSDTELTAILETEILRILAEDIATIEAALEKLEASDFMPVLFDRTMNLARHLQGNPSEIDSGQLSADSPNPVIREGGHILLDWPSWIRPITQEILGGELPVPTLITRNRPLGGFSGLLPSKKDSRTRILVGKIGLIDFTSIVNALMRGVTGFCGMLIAGHTGRALFEGPITGNQTFTDFSNEINAMLRLAKTQRKNELTFAALTVVENLGGNAERLRLAVEQEIFFTKILYEQIDEYLGAEIQKVVGCQADAVRPLDGGWDKYAAENDIGLSDAPSLLALRANAAVRTFFSGQEWFDGTGISRRPTTSIMVEFEVVNEAGAVESSRSNEFLIIENVCRQPLSPRVNGFSVSLAGLHESIHNEGGVPID